MRALSNKSKRLYCTPCDSITSISINYDTCTCVVEIWWHLSVIAVSTDIRHNKVHVQYTWTTIVHAHVHVHVHNHAILYCTTHIYANFYMYFVTNIVNNQIAYMYMYSILSLKSFIYFSHFTNTEVLNGIPYTVTLIILSPTGITKHAKHMEHNYLYKCRDILQVYVSGRCYL